MMNQDDSFLPGSITNLVNEKNIHDSRELLEIRARKLATVVEENDNKGDGVPVLEFLLSGERYAIQMNYVREVAILKEITRLPGTPSFILGIISLRGSILSLVDIRVILGLPSRGLTDYNRIIVLANKKMSFGILADSIIMTRTVQMNEINHPPPTVSGVAASYLAGVLPGPLIIINAEAMLNDSQMIVGGE